MTMNARQLARLARIERLLAGHVTTAPAKDRAAPALPEATVDRVMGIGPKKERRVRVIEGRIVIGAERNASAPELPRAVFERAVDRAMGIQPKKRGVVLRNGRIVIGAPIED